MKTWFADTFYFLALRNPKDAANERAVKITQENPNRVILTTAWVLTEVGDALADPINRQGFLDLYHMLRQHPKAIIVFPDQDLFERGVDLFEKRRDKEWSLTDCISFVVMKKRKIAAALTGDHHFEQAGFQALLK